MITIKTTKNNDVGVRVSKGTSMNEMYMGTGILLSILISKNGKTIDETMDLIKKIIESREGETNNDK